MFDINEFDTVIDRRNTDSAKWAKYAGRDILPMWVADMDFQAPGPVIEALSDRIRHGVFGYGCAGNELVESVRTYTRTAHGWDIDPHWIVWLPGLVTGLNVACRSIGPGTQSVLTTVPVYPPFLTAPENAGHTLVTNRMVEDRKRGWLIDFDDLESRIQGSTRLFILCNPHNPTGRVFTRGELKRLAEICRRHDMIICSDEIHCDLILEPGCRHIPIASLSPEIAARTITLMAPSKTFNIPGLSCSFAVIPDDDLRSRFKQAMTGIVPHVNVLGMAAARAAYDRCMPWLESLRSYLRSNRDRVCRAMDDMPWLRLSAIEATYLAWFDVSDLPVENPAKWFEAAGVGLSDGTDFDGRGYLRLNFGCPRSLLDEALERMALSVGALAARPPR